jgi:short-subunit dehydrogenase
MASLPHPAATAWRDATALVTGASSGIGRAIAVMLAEGGCHLVLTARRRERLEALRRELVSRCRVRVHIMPADLSAHDGAATLVSDIERAGLQIDLLVNNAGIGLAGAFAGTPWERDRAMLQLNIVSVVELTKRLLHPMLQRRRGHILLVGSVVSAMPVPYLAGYAATKAFISRFGEALAFEASGTGVHVTVLSPGSTATEFYAAAGYSKPVTGAGGIVQTPEQVAYAALRAAAAGERSITPGVANRLLMLSGRLLPTALLLRIAARIQRSRVPPFEIL